MDLTFVGWQMQHIADETYHTPLDERFVSLKLGKFDMLNKKFLRIFASFFGFTLVLTLWGISTNALADINDDLVMAAASGDAKGVRRLLADGANINVIRQNYTPLTGAAQWGHKNVVELLIAKGADVNAKNSKGDTPLHAAYKIDIIKLFIARGANVNARNNEGNTPLHLALRGTDGSDIANLLITNGADINAKSNEGITPLHIAAFRGQRDIVELLIEKGANVHAKDRVGRTPLDYARESKEVEVARLLVQSGSAKHH